MGARKRRPIDLIKLGRELAQAMQLKNLNRDELRELGESWLSRQSD